MSFRARGGPRGSPRGGMRGGSRGGRGGMTPERQKEIDPWLRDYNPGDAVAIGEVLHATDQSLVITNLMPQRIPNTRADVTVKGQLVGVVDEILGKTDKSYFSVKLHEGFPPESFKENTPATVDPFKTMNVKRYLPQSETRGGRGAPRGGARGGRGGRGGFGAPRGSPRGGFRGGFGDRGGRGGPSPRSRGGPSMRSRG